MSQIPRPGSRIQLPLCLQYTVHGYGIGIGGVGIGGIGYTVYVYGIRYTGQYIHIISSVLLCTVYCILTDYLLSTSRAPSQFVNESI